LKNRFCLAGPTCQQPVSVLTTQDGCPVPHAALFLVATLIAQRVLGTGGRRSSPPHVTYPHTPAPDITEEAATHSDPPSHSLAPPPHSSAPHRPQLLPPSLGADEPPPSYLTGPKEAPRHHAPPAPRACPQHRLAKLGNVIPPTIIFLYEHLAGHSLLWLFPQPADPAASSAPPSSSCPTTSPAASATPSAPHHRLFPVSTLATTEAPPPMSTPFPASPPRFSCSSM
jgi:hypothetical protein